MLSPSCQSDSVATPFDVGLATTTEDRSLSARPSMFGEFRIGVVGLVRHKSA